MPELLKSFDSILVVEPHLHRIKQLADLFGNKAKKISLAKLIAEFIKKKFIKKPKDKLSLLLIGPDEESLTWIKQIGSLLSVPWLVLKKHRYGPRKIKLKKISKDLKKVKGKTCIVIDDMISTGTTLLETFKLLTHAGASSLVGIAFHGLLIGDALNKLNRFAKIYCTNTLPSKAALIDISARIKEIINEIK